MFTFLKKYTKITEAEKSPARKKQRRFFREKGQKLERTTLGNPTAAILQRRMEQT